MPEPCGPTLSTADKTASSRALVVDDDTIVAEVYAACLSRNGFVVDRVENGEAALAFIERAEKKAPVDVVLLDLGLPGLHGLDVLARIVALSRPPAVIVVTGEGSITVAVQAMRGGAFDFLVKPVSRKRLVAAVSNAIEARAPALDGGAAGLERGRLGALIGDSPPMQEVYQVIARAAPSRASIFITGESGTGKELCAAAIHRLSPRRARPFVAVNCAAIPRELMESEIFGHVRGAFTGAHIDREGAAQRADGGTLFFDEICEMDLALQSKLLRFVQTGSFQRVGSNATEQVDVRFVCATNREPAAEVAAGRFREDLYYRLHVIPLALPPLRTRGRDVIAIARTLIVRIAAEEGRPAPTLTPEAEACLAAYAWPGNVRELQNVLRRALVLHDGEALTPAMLPPEVGASEHRNSAAPAATNGKASGASAGGAGAPVRPLWAIERDAIEAAIAQCRGNVPKAAALLGISDSTIYRKRRRWTSDETDLEDK